MSLSVGVLDQYAFLRTKHSRYIRNPRERVVAASLNEFWCEVCDNTVSGTEILNGRSNCLDDTSAIATGDDRRGDRSIYTLEGTVSDSLVYWKVRLVYSRAGNDEFAVIETGGVHPHENLVGA